MREGGEIRSASFKRMDSLNRLQKRIVKILNYTMNNAK
jgi:hypothetical protein